MNTEWSLDCLYTGYNDPAFEEDMKHLKELADEIKNTPAKLSEQGAGEVVPYLLTLLETYYETLSRLDIYVSLRSSVNTAEKETKAWEERIMQIHSAISRELAGIDRYFAEVKDMEFIQLRAPFVKDYEFYFAEKRKKAAHMLSEESEEILFRMNLSGGAAWGKLQKYLTSTVTADYRGQKLTLSEIRNLAYSPDAKVRKDAYEAELACYEPIRDSVAFAMNYLKSQVNTVTELRGYASALDMTLEQSRMKRETLDAMFGALKEYLPKFHEYLKAKAAYLGHSNGLPWYDLFAPVGRSGRMYSLEEAREYLINHFQGFAPDMAEMIRRAFDEEWIDFYPRAGKVGGAFCCNIPFLKQSRILTNYDGTLSDIVTLAHELGHAYHGQQIENHRPLNTDYTMPVAETASNFNEIIIMNAAIREAEGEEKLALIESRLQDTTQIICDIYSRFLIEKAVFDGRKDQFFFADDLCQLMIDAQKEAYGDGLDPNVLHPYMWICKSHYYSSSTSYYNFPYAFGGLFARGLFAQYEKEGEAFLPKYRALLHATTVSTVEEVAAMAGIDLTSPEFWRESLESIGKEIDQFLALTAEN